MVHTTGLILIETNLNGFEPVFVVTTANFVLQIINSIK